MRHLWQKCIYESFGTIFQSTGQYNFCLPSEGSRERKMMKKIIVKLGRVDICFVFVYFYCHWLSKFCSRSITNRVLKIVGQHAKWTVASPVGQEIQRFVFSEYHRFWNHDLPHQFRCNQETVCSKWQNISVIDLSYGCWISSRKGKVGEKFNMIRNVHTYVFFLTL